MSRLFLITKDMTTGGTQWYHGFDKGEILELASSYPGYMFPGQRKYELRRVGERGYSALTQTISFKDMIELREVAFADLKEGMQILADRQLASNIGSCTNKHQIVTVKQSAHQRNNIGYIVNLLEGDGDNQHSTGIWYYERQNEQAKFYEVIPFPPEIAEESVDSGAEQAYDTQPQAEVKPRKKVIYEVIFNGSQVLMTKSRKQARKMKANLGGKDAGVYINMYSLDKEIR